MTLDPHENAADLSHDELLAAAVEHIAWLASNAALTAATQAIGCRLSEADIEKIRAEIDRLGDLLFILACRSAAKVFNEADADISVTDVTAQAAITAAEMVSDVVALASTTAYEASTQAALSSRLQAREN